MEFLKKLFGQGKPQVTDEQTRFRGVAPNQSQEEQDTTRAHMEEEMAEQKERRDADAAAPEDEASTETESNEN